MNDIYTTDKTKKERTEFITLLLGCLCSALIFWLPETPATLAQDNRECATFPRMIDAQQTIRDYSPGDNSIGVKEAVEKILCETGELNEVRLDQADLSELDASDALFYRVSFVDTDLSYAILNGATFEYGTVSNANLQHSSAIGTTFRGTNMEGAYWDCADFTRSRFIDVHWRNISAQASIMRHMTFKRYGWESVNLGFADLRDVSIFGYADRASTIASANISGMNVRTFTDLFRSQLDQVFGSFGACYMEEDPPVDSESSDWTVQDGAIWRGEKLELFICGKQTLDRTNCKSVVEDPEQTE